MQGIEIEREVRHRLPAILAEILERRVVSGPEESNVGRDTGVDLELEDGARRWIVQVKASSSPGVIADAAHSLNYLKASARDDEVALLVVPYMTRAGAKAAADRGINWVDLAGNARVRNGELFISVEGRRDPSPSRGRPSSPFAPKSSRVARRLLIDPMQWWRQKDLAESTGLDPGHVSRTVGRLEELSLLDRQGQRFRPRDPKLLLDAWAEEYRFDRHDVVIGHATGTGMELARELDKRLSHVESNHAFTGLVAAYVLNPFARFRLISVFVEEDPRSVADDIGLRREERGANVQVIGPDDHGVFDGGRSVDGLPCVAPPQAYLDLLHLPERARDAAAELRASGDLWP